jgi:sugar (pentulose or hexulose) kinase
MPVVLGIDLGTTTITVLALDAGSGTILAHATAPNRAEITRTNDKARGRSEWDVRRIAETACGCLRTVAGQVEERRPDLAGLGITGQQHGVVLLKESLAPLTPFINWQDRRAEETCPGTDRSFVAQAIERAGPDAPRRTGCRLAAGYMGITLFWMRETGCLPPAGTACFLMDYFGALLAGQPPVTDATCAASSGLFDVARGSWDETLIAALGLPPSHFPEVRPSGSLLGGLTRPLAAATGLPAGLPIFGGIGDNQASFLGSVARPEQTVLVNVGTGGQVTAWTGRHCHDPLLETRPFPGGGYLLVCAGLCGGGSYAVLERFFRAVGTELFGTAADQPLYPLMNRLAAAVPPDAGGMRCEPFFTGTRVQPELRAAWKGVSAENLTPGHLTRALLEGMAHTFRGGAEQIARNLDRPRDTLVGAGNGLRENLVLADAVARAFGRPLAFPLHREEAAFGAALLAAVGAGAHPDLASAGRLIRHVPATPPT